MFPYELDAFDYNTENKIPQVIFIWQNLSWI